MNFSELSKTKLNLLKDEIQKVVPLLIRLKLGRIQMLAKGDPDHETKREIISQMENIDSTMKNMMDKLEIAEAVVANLFRKPEVDTDGITELIENMGVTSPLESDGIVAGTPSKNSGEADLQAESSDDTTDDNSSHEQVDDESIPFSWEISLPLFLLALRKSKKVKSKFCSVLKEFNSFPGVKDYSGYKNFKPQNFLKTEKKANRGNESVSEFLCLLEKMLEHSEYGGFAKEIAKFALYLRSQKRVLADELKVSLKKWQMTFWSDELKCYSAFHQVYYEPSPYILEKTLTNFKDLPFFKQRCATDFTKTMEPRRAILMTLFYKILSNYDDCKILDSDFDFISTRPVEDIEKVEQDALAAMFSVKNSFEIFYIWFSCSSE